MTFTEAEVESIVKLRIAQREQLKGPYANAAPVPPGIRRRLEDAHRYLDLATGPSGARAAMAELMAAIKEIDAAWDHP